MKCPKCGKPLTLKKDAKGKYYTHIYSVAAFFAGKVDPCDYNKRERRKKENVL